MNSSPGQRLIPADDVRIKQRIDDSVVVYRSVEDRYLVYNGNKAKILDLLMIHRDIGEAKRRLFKRLRNKKETVEAFFAGFIEELTDTGYFTVTAGEDRNGSPYWPRKGWPLDEVFLELTRNCNLSCFHCYIDKDNVKNQLSTGQLSDIIDQLDDMGVLKVKVTGGEPMMHRDFFPIVEAIIEKKMGLRVYSNGSFLTEANIARMADLGIREIQVSLDGFKPSTHDRFRRKKGNFAFIRDALPLLGRAGITVIISFTATDHNVHEVDLIGEYAGNNAHVRLNISPYINYHSGRLETEKILDVSEETVKKISEAYFRMSDLWSRKMHYGFTYPIDYPGYCGMGIFSCYISADGKVSLCPLLRQDGYVAGDLTQTPLETVWQTGDVFRKYREYTLRDMETCATCSHIYRCRGGCRARAIFHSNDFLSADPISCSMLRYESNKS